MRIISIDIGISNFAYCIFNDNQIEQWDIINLLDFDICTFCGKEAIYKKNDERYCKCHAKSHKIYKIPQKKMLNYNKLTKEKLKEFVKINNIPSDLKNKQTILGDIAKHYDDNNYFEMLNKNKCSDTDLLQIGIKLNAELDKLGVFDIVLIEDQLGPNAVRMSCIQYMTSQYYIANNITNIHIVSSKHKLEYWVDDKSLSYKERKLQSVQITTDILSRNNIFSDQSSTFSKYKKKDDLSDCFLQGVWYLKKHDINNII